MVTDLRAASYQERNRRLGRARDVSGSGNRRLGSVLQERIRRQQEAEAQNKAAFEQANFQDTKGDLYKVTGFDQQGGFSSADREVASFERPNFSSVDYGGEVYAFPPDSRQYRFPSREEYITADVDSQIKSKKQSRVFGIVPNPVGRAEGFLLEKERQAASNTPQWLRTVGGQLPIVGMYEQKRDVASTKYDTLKDLRKQSIRPSESTKFRVQSAVLDYGTSPLTIAGDYGTGYLFGAGTRLGLNVAGRAAGQRGFNIASGALLVGGGGLIGYGGYKSYQEQGAYGLTSYGLSTGVGFAGGVQGFSSGVKPGEYLTGVSNVRGSKFRVDAERFKDEFPGAGRATVTSDGLVQVEGFSYGRYFKTEVPQKLILSGNKFGKGYAVSGQGTASVRLPSGRRVGFSQDYTGVLRGGFVSLEDSGGLKFFSQNKVKGTVSEVTGLDYLTPGVSGDETVFVTRSDFATFKGKELQGAGRAIGTIQSETFTRRFRGNGLELPSRRVVISKGASVGVTGRNYVSEKLYLKGNKLLGDLKSSVVRPATEIRTRIIPKRTNNLGIGSNERIDLGELKGVTSNRGSGNQLTLLKTQAKAAPKPPSLKPNFEGMTSVITLTKPKSIFLPATGLKAFSKRKTQTIQEPRIKPRSIFGTPQISLIKPSQKQILIPQLKPRQLYSQTPKQIPVLQQKQDQRIVPFVPQTLVPPPPTTFTGGGLLAPIGLPIGFGSTEYRGKGRNFQYIPSLTAVLGNIRGNAPKNLGGLEIRPLRSIRRRRKK